jgi:hypothetical protein
LSLKSFASFRLQHIGHFEPVPAGALSMQLSFEGGNNHYTLVPLADTAAGSDLRLCRPALRKGYAFPGLSYSIVVFSARLGLAG